MRYALRVKSLLNLLNLLNFLTIYLLKRALETLEKIILDKISIFRSSAQTYSNEVQ